MLFVGLLSILFMNIDMLIVVLLVYDDYSWKWVERGEVMVVDVLRYLVALFAADHVWMLSFLKFLFKNFIVRLVET